MSSKTYGWLPVLAIFSQFPTVRTTQKPLKLWTTRSFLNKSHLTCFSGHM